MMPGTNATLGGGISGTLEFLAGDSQLPFFLAVPLGTTGGTFSQTFTYATPGVYAPSFDFEGQINETATARFTLPPDLSLRRIVSFVSVGVRPAVPEPSTWAMMILGFLGVGFMAYRREIGFWAQPDLQPTSTTERTASGGLFLWELFVRVGAGKFASFRSPRDAGANRYDDERCAQASRDDAV
jgi:hypothetical protein